MNRNVSSGTAVRTLGKVILGATLVCAAIAVGFGGTALFIYHQLGGGYELSGKQAKPGTRAVASDRKEPRSPARSRTNPADDAENRSQIRPVAATSTDRSAYTYADNRSGALEASRGRDRSGNPGSRTTLVPAPLASSVSGSDDTASASNVPPPREPALSDPESRLIVDSRTGRVIGIDGSAGAAAEARRQDALQPQTAVPVATAVRPVQTPPPEVRVATPVVVKRAIPVSAEPADANFNAASELAQDNTTRPVLRAQAVLPQGARVVKTVRIYRLPDGSETAVRD